VTRAASAQTRTAALTGALKTKSEADCAASVCAGVRALSSAITPADAASAAATSSGMQRRAMSAWRSAVLLFRRSHAGALRAPPSEPRGETRTTRWGAPVLLHKPGAATCSSLPLLLQRRFMQCGLVPRIISRPGPQHRAC